MQERWKDASMELRFCAANTFVNSIKHSGWRDDDRSKAAKDHYVKNRNNPNVTDSSCWRIEMLRDYNQSTTTAKKVNCTAQDSAQNATASEESDTDIKNLSGVSSDFQAKLKEDRRRAAKYS
jgi:hypothetical protein